MPLTVDTLIVRRLRQVDKTPSGLARPRVFRASTSNFADQSLQLKIGRTIERLPGGRGVVARAQRYMPGTEAVDQRYAEEYDRACKALNRTPAGRIAKELLFSFLSTDQRKTAERYGYFDATIFNPLVVEAGLRMGTPITFGTVKARFLRTFPNGNIILGAPSQDAFQVCLHPAAAYPIDDICLAQLMALVSDPDEFISQGNVTETGTRVRRNFIRMFEELKGNTLVLPYLKEE